MNVMTRGQPPAEIYEDNFVPALFAQWGPVLVREARVARGDTVLDVGCGTGAAKRAAAVAAGPEGRVVGLDPNPEMLTVARRRPERIDWRDGAAETLPLDDATFDAVISQFAAMFFTDRAQALAEMRRVVRPGGRIAVAVCGDLRRSPGYHDFAALLDRLFGTATGDAFRAPFVLGDGTALQAAAAAAGLAGAQLREHHGTVQFASIADLVSTERACVWTLGGMLDDEQFDRLLTEAQTALARHTGADGVIRFDMPPLILKAVRET